MDGNVLKMRGISKSFNGINVLDNVDFSLKKGEVHALVGGNGAGKSTLMKILTGVYQSDSGQIYIDNKKVNISSYNDVKNNNVSMIFQEFSLIPTLTVAQNIFLNREKRTNLGLIDDKECVKQSRDILNQLGIDIDPNELVENLGVGYWQMTEIAKALSQEAKILIMDEPTSSLTEKETDVLFKFINRLKDRGISIIYISHRMEEIFKICDRITVLRDGKMVVTENCENITLKTIIKHMVGKQFEAFEWIERSYSTDNTPVLEVRNLNAGPIVRDINFKIYPGEILGIAGLMGSGRTELVRAIFGIDNMESGEVLIHGSKVKITNEREGIKAGVALIPEDRRVQGLILEHSIKDNIILPILSKVKKGLSINEKEAKNISQRFINKLGIKTDGLNKQVSLLSGGNQQKVVLSKWLANNPDILLLDEPTIGVDIAAKTEITDIIRELADEGKAILVISSELTELLAISDRVLIMHNGKIKQAMNRKEISSEEDLQYAIQG